MNFTKQLFFTAAFLLLLPFASLHAATLYFSPAEGEYGFGDVFAVDMRVDLDNPSECINTVDASLVFDKDYLELVDFSTGDSILSLWIKQPTSADIAEINHEKRVDFTGGTPGGYCGKIPGDPGDSNIVGRLAFKVNNFNDAIVPPPVARIYFLPETKVLLNDGSGSEANLTLREGKFGIRSQMGVQRKEWDNLLSQDLTEPEPFVLEIQQSADVFGGQYYLIFNTNDKQTGIDHYEVRESELSGLDQNKTWYSPLFSWLPSAGTEPVWQRANSPYVLKDQTLSSLIEVRAIDKAKNERVAEYNPEEMVASAKKPVSNYWFMVLLIPILLIIGYIVKRTSDKKQIS